MPLARESPQTSNILLLIINSPCISTIVDQRLGWEAFIPFPPFCKLFLFDRYGQSTQLLPYIRPVNEVYAASGPDGFPRVFIAIILPASKAHALNGFLKTPVRPVCHHFEKCFTTGGVTVKKTL
jgi:hypothetical protein